MKLGKYSTILGENNNFFSILLLNTFIFNKVLGLISCFLFLAFRTAELK